MRARPSLRVQSCKCRDKRLVNQLRVSGKGQVVDDILFGFKESTTIMMMTMMIDNDEGKK